MAWLIMSSLIQCEHLLLDLTIITVCRNAEKTIRRCLLAVSPLLHHGKFNTEHIIVDGHSTDSTLRQIELAGDHPNRRVYSEPPLGIYHAMNVGISVASGRFVLFSNADDYVNADGVLSVLESEERNAFASDVCHGLCCIHDEQGQLLRIQGTHSSVLLSGTMIEHPSTFVKLKCLKQFGCFDERYLFASDLDLMMRIKASNVSFSLLPFTVSHYFLGGASRSSAAEIERLKLLRKNKLISLPKFLHRVMKASLRHRA